MINKVVQLAHQKKIVCIAHFELLFIQDYIQLTTTKTKI